MNAALNRHTALSRIGSYWGEHAHPDSSSLMRSLVYLRNLQDLPAGVWRARGALIGEKTGFKTNWDHRFDERDVEVLGPDLQARIAEKLHEPTGTAMVVIRRPSEYDLYGSHVAMQDEDLGGYLGTEDCRYLLWPVLDSRSEINNPDQLFNRFILRWPYGSTPYGMMSGTKTLLLGIDYEAGWGALVFREHPLELFPDHRILVLSSSEVLHNPLNYVLGVEEFSGEATPISLFMRESIGPDQLLKALAQVAGLVCLPQDGVLEASQEFCGGVRYQFPWGSVAVPYPHTQLEIGTQYLAGHLVGGAIKIWGATGRHGWFREIDWPDEGLSLDGLCPFKGLWVPDRAITFEAYETGPGGKLHVRPYVDGDTAVRTRWWGWIRDSELWSGVWLNDALGLVAEGDRTYLSAMEFWFRYLLSTHSLVVDLALKAVGAESRQRVLDFLAQHRMLSSNLIILDR